MSTPEVKVNLLARPEQHKTLLTATQIIKSLGVSRATFYGDRKRGIPGLVKRLRAKGLRVVTFPALNGGQPRKRYVASSLDKLIEAASVHESL